MEFDAAAILIPLFGVAGAGFFLTRIFDLSEETLVRLLTDFLVPSLVFYSLYTSEIELLHAVRLFGATNFITFTLLGLAWIYARMAGLKLGSFAPAVMFPNCGFLGFPLITLWGGLPALNHLVIYEETQNIFIFTIGIIIVTGGFHKKSLKAIVTSPLLWSIVAGFIFRYAHIPIPKPILDTFEFGGQGATSLSAFLIGVSISRRKLIINKDLFVGLVMRFVGGFFVGLLAVTLFHIEGMPRTVVLVASSLPSAVFSVVLPLRYKVNADLAGSMVLVSTIMSIFLIPLIFKLAEIF